MLCFADKEFFGTDVSDEVNFQLDIFLDFLVTLVTLKNVHSIGPEAAFKFIATMNLLIVMKNITTTSNF